MRGRERDNKPGYEREMRRLAAGTMVGITAAAWLMRRLDICPGRTGCRGAWSLSAMYTMVVLVGAIAPMALNRVGLADNRRSSFAAPGDPAILRSGKFRVSSTCSTVVAKPGGAEGRGGAAATGKEMSEFSADFTLTLTT